MASKAKAIPDGHHTVTPHLVVRGAAKAMEFYKNAFGAKELFRVPGPDGKTVMHAEMMIGDSPFYLCDEFPDMGATSPATLKGSPVTIHLYVQDVDKTYSQAVSAGAKATMPVSDMFWGDRYGKLEDPFGHHWSVATHTEDVAPEEIAKRSKAAFGGCG
ncbi:MAG: VOC family protein [Planctomycetota bacterium]